MIAAALSLYIAAALFGWAIGHLVERVGRIPDDLL